MVSVRTVKAFRRCVKAECCIVFVERCWWKIFGRVFRIVRSENRSGEILLVFYALYMFDSVYKNGY